MNEHEDLIELHDLSVNYPGAAAPAVSGVNLRVRRGDRLLLLGPSGCGKSTLLFAMAGIIPNMVPATVRGHLVTRGARIGVVLQNPEAQMIAPTVEEEIAFGLENHGVPPDEMEHRITEVLSRFGLEKYRQRSPARLSGGEAQKVALAAAVALKPELLFLDEPTAFLDPRATREFFEALSRLSVDTALVIVEHKLEHVLPVTDRYVRLGRDGHVAAEGVPSDLSQSFWYQGILEHVTDQKNVKGQRNKDSAVGASLECREARHEYADGTVALANVSMTALSGECVVVMGPNGSGKSTLLDKVSALLPVEKESIYLNQRDLRRMKPAALYEQLLTVPQNPEHMFLTERVYDELSLQGASEQQIEEVAGEFGLQPLLQRNPYSLSEGEKRRLTVAAAVLDGRPFLLFDEPTYGLDADAVATLVGMLRGLSSRAVTLLVVTHSPELAFLVADRIIVLDAGTVAFSGTPAELARDPSAAHHAFLPVWLREEKQHAEEVADVTGGAL